MQNSTFLQVSALSTALLVGCSERKASPIGAGTPLDTNTIPAISSAPVFTNSTATINTNAIKLSMIAHALSSPKNNVPMILDTVPAEAVHTTSTFVQRHIKPELEIGREAAGAIGIVDTRKARSNPLSAFQQPTSGTAVDFVELEQLLADYGTSVEHPSMLKVEVQRVDLSMQPSVVQSPTDKFLATVKTIHGEPVLIMFFDPNYDFTAMTSSGIRKVMVPPSPLFAIEQAAINHFQEQLQPVVKNMRDSLLKDGRIVPLSQGEAVKILDGIKEKFEEPDIYRFFTTFIESGQESIFLGGELQVSFVNNKGAPLLELKIDPSPAGGFEFSASRQAILEKYRKVIEAQ